MAGKAPVLLQLLFGAHERVAAHHGPEHMPKLGPRRELAKFAFLGGEAVNVGSAGLGLGLGREHAPVFALHGVEAAEKLAALLKGGVARLQAVDFRTDFRRPDSELYGFIHGSRSPVDPARRRR